MWEFNVFVLYKECTISDEDHDGMKEWLKNHTEPSAKVKQYMEKTSIKRAEWIRENSGLSISSVSNEYPRLFDTSDMVSKVCTTIITVYSVQFIHINFVSLYVLVCRLKWTSE